MDIDDVEISDIDDICDADDNIVDCDLPEDELSSSEIGDIVDTIQDSRSMGADLEDPDLFENAEAGNYSYSESILGKSACGVLELSDDSQRDPVA